jgi:MFS family permease
MGVAPEKDLESNSPSTVDEARSNNASRVETTIEQSYSTEKGTSTSLQLEGWRRIVLLISIFIGLFLSFLDSTIVSVALATIADQFDDFDRTTWVVTAYLLTYMAFAIIIARLSDIFGQKAAEIASFLLFIGFSLGCALSKNMTQLIIFRALQGIGGSGLYSMTMIIALKAVPLRQIGIISGAIGMVLVMSGVLGPILSGAITHNHHSSTWRWIFYLNVPIGGVALVALLIAWPSDKSKKSFTKKAFLSVDVLGSVLLLAAAVLLIFALEEAGAFIYAWDSSMIVACLCVSGMAFVVFVIWQEWLDKHPSWPVEMVFPVRVARQRVVGAAMM